MTKEKVTEKVIEYGTTTNIVNEISTDQAAAAVNENVKRRSPLHTVTKGKVILYYVVYTYFI